MDEKEALLLLRQNGHVAYSIVAMGRFVHVKCHHCNKSFDTTGRSEAEDGMAKHRKNCPS